MVSLTLSVEGQAAQAFELKPDAPGPIRIGKHKGNEFIADARGISSNHAEMLLIPGKGLCIRDTSTNGTGVQPPNSDELKECKKGTTDEETQVMDGATIIVPLALWVAGDTNVKKIKVQLVKRGGYKEGDHLLKAEEKRAPANSQPARAPEVQQKQAAKSAPAAAKNPRLVTNGSKEARADSDSDEEQLITSSRRASKEGPSAAEARIQLCHTVFTLFDIDDDDLLTSMEFQRFLRGAALEGGTSDWDPARRMAGAGMNRLQFMMLTTDVDDGKLYRALLEGMAEQEIQFKSLSTANAMHTVKVVRVCSTLAADVPVGMTHLLRHVGTGPVGSEEWVKLDAIGMTFEDKYGRTGVPWVFAGRTPRKWEAPAPPGGWKRKDSKENVPAAKPAKKVEPKKAQPAKPPVETTAKQTDSSTPREESTAKPQEPPAPPAKSVSPSETAAKATGPLDPRADIGKSVQIIRRIAYKEFEWIAGQSGTISYVDKDGNALIESPELKGGPKWILVKDMDAVRVQGTAVQASPPVPAPAPAPKKEAPAPAPEPSSPKKQEVKPAPARAAPVPAGPPPDVHITLKDGRQLHVDEDGWAGVAMPGEDQNTEDSRRLWTVGTGKDDGIISLRDGRQLYVDPDGNVCLAESGADTNTEGARRVWSVQGDSIALKNGMELHVDPDGWAGAAKRDKGNNTDKARRAWKTTPLGGSQPQPSKAVASSEPSREAAKQWVLRRHTNCVFGDGLQPDIIHLTNATTTIGRETASCDTVMTSKRTSTMISRIHAIIEKDGRAFTITDKSTNGVLIDGVRMTVNQKQRLEDGNVITFGLKVSEPELDYQFVSRS